MSSELSRLGGAGSITQAFQPAQGNLKGQVICREYISSAKRKHKVDFSTPFTESTERYDLVDGGFICHCDERLGVKTT
jgi:hypothetical protein